METQKLGITHLTLAVLTIVEVCNVVDGMSRAEGVAAKGQELFRLTDELMSIPNLQPKQILPEYKDLDEAEKAQLLDAVKTKFDIADDKLEHAIEGGLLIIIRAEQLFTEARDLVKSIKGESVSA